MWKIQAEKTLEIRRCLLTNILDNTQLHGAFHDNDVESLPQHQRKRICHPSKLHKKGLEFGVRGPEGLLETLQQEQVAIKVCHRFCHIAFKVKTEKKTMIRQHSLHPKVCLNCQRSSCG